MDGGTTYDVRVYRTEVYKGRRVTTYKVRWKVSGRLWKEGFRTAAQADSPQLAGHRHAQGRGIQRCHRQTDSLGARQD
jgi:hypothetical protein